MVWSWSQWKPAFKDTIHSLQVPDREIHGSGDRNILHGTAAEWFLVVGDMDFVLVGLASADT